MDAIIHRRVSLNLNYKLKSRPPAVGTWAKNIRSSEYKNLQKFRALWDTGFESYGRNGNPILKDKNGLNEPAGRSLLNSETI